MEFITQYTKTERIFTCPGSPEKVTYGLHYDKNGVVELKPKGKINLYDEIQSHADSCDINVILKKFAAGDTTVLNQRLGSFADVSDYPTNLAEFLNTLAASEELFATLPSEIKANFNNSLTQFVAAMDSDNFADLLVPKQPEVVSQAPAKAGEGDAPSADA